MGAVASFAERYLPRCAGVRILATSRELLGVRGERALGTPPLDVADDPARAGASDAVELFMVRASAAAPDFDADAADVAHGRPDLPPPRWSSARHRARRGSPAGPLARTDRDAPRRPVPALARGRAHARSGGGVELRPAHRCGAGSVRAPGGVPRRLQPRGGGDGRVRCRRRRARRPRSAHAARREVARHDRDLGRHLPVPAARDASGVRARPTRSSAARSIGGTTGCSSGP